MPGGELLQDFYASVESQLIANGRMRRDVAPVDAPYTTDDLVRDFERVALYDEYTDVNGRFVHQQAPARLRRWTDPVRVAVMTGGSASPEDAARDRANVAAFTRRLGQLTSVDMGMGAGAGRELPRAVHDQRGAQGLRRPGGRPLPELRARGGLGAARHAARHLLHRLRLLEARRSRRPIRRSSC